ncbi:MAG: BamA/TamA family outer membrane protein [Candidatus Marinimicrobia bacterium]|nr:BamA/TamA family outer membrane protein [Candidatus Neomarinimicrobiota bacterium]
MIKRSLFVLTFSVLLLTIGIAQDSGKTGWSFGGIPAVAYDTDTGFLYGAILNFYDYGDGSLYPGYGKSVYLEWTRTTKGSDKKVAFLDFKNVLNKGYRVTVDLSYLTEKALDFYGFNGYEVEYNSLLTDDADDNSLYATRVYYKHARELLRTTVDVQNKLPLNNARWFAGIGSYGTTIGTVDVESLNEGNDENPLPDSVNTLYDIYVDEGWIDSDEKEGGRTNLVKAGIVYDTRDNEPNPMKGMWSEAMFLFASSESGAYSQYVLTHRQYFTLKDKSLSLAYRVGMQGKLSGDIPFYMLPYVHSTYKTTDGWGGSKTLRGILRNRVVGDGVAYGNIELRWKFARFTLANQNFYLALNSFIDGGKVYQRYEYSTSSVIDLLVVREDDTFHIGYGGGFRVAINENFIIAVDYGMAKDEQDGSSGLYIGLGYLF